VTYIAMSDHWHSVGPSDRSSIAALLSRSPMLQGDMLILDTGDKVIADGLFVQGHGLVIDEASLTGESDPQNKSPAKPWLRAGTQVRM